MTTEKNPEFSLYGSTRMQWLESVPASELRDANEYLQDYRFSGNRLGSTQGYYCDLEGNSTAVPCVYLVPHACEPCDGSGMIGGDDCDACDGYGQTFEYVPGVRDPINTGSALVDWSDATDDSVEAAKAAHALAERYASDARDDDEVSQREQELEYLLTDSMPYVRRAHSGAIRLDDATGARLRQELRERAAKTIKRIRELRS